MNTLQKNQVKYSREIKVKTFIYSLVIIFSDFAESVLDTIEEELASVTNLVSERAERLCFPSVFIFNSTGIDGLSVEVQATKIKASSKWTGETALMRMIEDEMLITVGDKLRLTNNLKITNYYQYNVTRRYLVELGYIETITGKDLTFANLSYHLNK